MRSLERLGNLPREAQRVIDGQRTSLELLLERFALDELHRKIEGPVVLVEAMDRCDVRMVERGQEPGFTLEAREPALVTGERRGERLDGGLAAELRVGGTIDLTHTADTEWAGDPKATQLCASGERHQLDLKDIRPSS